MKRLKREDLQEDSRSVIYISSSDDEEANKDPSLATVEKARERRKGKEIEMDGAVSKEEPLGTTSPGITEEGGASDNLIFRKLLRGPRYFDPAVSNLEACFMCGKDGHTAVNCPERRERPCFVCGMFGHIAKQCSQEQDCFNCRRRGHIAKNCPYKHTNTSQDSVTCLRGAESHMEIVMIMHHLGCATNVMEKDILHEIAKRMPRDVTKKGVLHEIAQRMPRWIDGKVDHLLGDASTRIEARAASGQFLVIFAKRTRRKTRCMRSDGTNLVNTEQGFGILHQHLVKVTWLTR